MNIFSNNNNNDNMMARSSTKVKYAPGGKTSNNIFGCDSENVQQNKSSTRVNMNAPSTNNIFGFDSENVQQNKLSTRVNVNAPGGKDNMGKFLSGEVSPEKSHSAFGATKNQSKNVINLTPKSEKNQMATSGRTSHKNQSKNVFNLTPVNEKAKKKQMFAHETTKQKTPKARPQTKSSQQKVKMLSSNIFAQPSNDNASNQFRSSTKRINPPGGKSNIFG